MDGKKLKSLRLHNVFFENLTIGNMGQGLYKNGRLEHILNDTKTPVIITIDGGGTIHRDFGVDVSSLGGVDKTNVTLSLSEADHGQLVRLHEEMVSFLVERRDVYFPDCKHSDDLLREMANKTVSDPKPKKEGNGFWPANLVAKLEKSDDCQLDSTGRRRCKIKNESTGQYIDNPYDIKGYRWTKAKIELKSIYFQTGKISFGFAKRLRYLAVVPNADEYDVESDSDSEVEHIAKKQKVQE